ncbi:MULTISPECIES: MFS transporter [Acidobacteriaceae]|uniref:MFS transporter n=1 Tax=Acidobacteriaceae TaxID=204434 RepID=UPI0020B135A2|nr:MULTISPECIES: MFS transporter [Acidobacteriaceae]MDW5267687.1 MFS transporter [Edaphobacter sp.]
MTNRNASENSLGYQGWKVTFAAFVGVMVSFAAVVPYTFSLFITPLHNTFGWKIEAISRGFAIAALTVAACSPTIGTLLDKLPPRRVILPSIVVFACGIASLALLRGHIIQFYTTYLLLGIVGNGTAQLAYSRAVLTWFEERRGLAIAVMLTGSATGSIFLPIIAQHVMTMHGWRASYLVLGALALLGFPLTALLVRNRAAAEIPAQPVVFHGGVGAVLRTRVFWLIAVPVMFAAFSANAAIAHLAALLTSRGVNASSAALALSMLGISSIAGRLTTGYLLDRIFAPLVSLAGLVLAGIGVVVLAYAAIAPVGLTGAFLLGFAGGSEADVVPYLIAKYFGRARFSTLYGLTWTAYAIGGATGPVLMGHCFDTAGRYLPMTFALFALPCFLAAIMQLALPPYPQHQSNSALVTEIPVSASVTTL